MYSWERSKEAVDCAIIHVHVYDNETQKKQLFVSYLHASSFVPRYSFMVSYVCSEMGCTKCQPNIKYISGLYVVNSQSVMDYSCMNHVLLFLSHSSMRP